MTDSLPCPGCHTPLPPEATGCQICMRGRTKQEIMRGYAKIREDKARQKRRPFQILAVALILGGGGKLYMTYRAPLAAMAGSIRDAVGQWSDDMRDPKHYGPKPEAAPEQASSSTESAAVDTPPVAPESAVRTQLFPPEHDSAQKSAPAPLAASPAVPKPLAKNMRRVSGTVYDLSTLEPVPDAQITFLQNNQGPQTVTTNKKGAYTIDLPREDGWTVSMNAPLHRRGQVFDLDPSYRVRDSDERRAAHELISDGDMIPAPVNWPQAATTVRLDLIAIRNNWIGTP